MAALSSCLYKCRVAHLVAMLWFWKRGRGGVRIVVHSIGMYVVRVEGGARATKGRFGFGVTSRVLGCCVVWSSHKPGKVPVIDTSYIIYRSIQILRYI